MAELQDPPVIPTFDGTRATPLFQADPPATLEPNRVYAIVSAYCGGCHQLIALTDYPTRTPDGRPITYLNIALVDDTAGNPPMDANDLDFVERHFPQLQPFMTPTFVTVDAQGKPHVEAVGTADILPRFFPEVMQRLTQTRPTPRPQEAVEEDLGLAPAPAAPTPSQEAPLTQDQLRTVGSGLGNVVLSNSAEQTPPAATPQGAPAERVRQ